MANITENVCPENIVQGQIGNCWFIASLSVLAERPYLISRLLKSTNPENPKNVEAWLCSSGKFVPIILDNQFPVNSNSTKALYAQPNEENTGTWQMWIEKAFAKLYQGYSHLSMGHARVALAELTGASTFHIELDN